MSEYWDGIVKVGSDAAEMLAQTLAISEDELDVLDGREDDKIDLWYLAHHKDKEGGADLTDRIITAGRTCGIKVRRGKDLERGYSFMALVDDGDGVIGAGDIFLYNDGYYRDCNWLFGCGDMEFRVASLFKPRNVQRALGRVAGKSPALPADGAQVVTDIEAKQGRPVSEAFDIEGLMCCDNLIMCI